MADKTESAFAEPLKASLNTISFLCLTLNILIFKTVILFFVCTVCSLLELAVYKLQ